MAKKKQTGVSSKAKSKAKAVAVNSQIDKTKQNVVQKKAQKTVGKAIDNSSSGGSGGGSVVSAGGLFDRFKWLLVIALGVLSVFGNIRFQHYPFAQRLLVLIVIGLVMMGLALRTNMGKSFSRFVIGARAEMRKVVWPTRQEVTQTTIIVIIVVIITSIILWAVDGLFGYIIQSLIM